MNRELYNQKKERFTSSEILSFFQNHEKIQNELMTMFVCFFGGLFFFCSLLAEYLGFDFFTLIFGFIIMSIGYIYHTAKYVETIEHNQEVIINQISVNDSIQVLKDKDTHEKTKIFLLSNFKPNKINHIKNVCSDEPEVLRIIKLFK